MCKLHYICNIKRQFELSLQAEELKEKEEKQKILKKAFQERGVPYYSIDSMADDAF
jgi:pimeloyl-CoA synthetase